MIRQDIIDQMKMAMKSREAEKLQVLRFLLSEIKNVEIDAKHELNDEEVITLFRKEVKRRKESIEQYKTAKREDIVNKEEAELKVIDTFLPAQMEAQVIEKLVDEILSKTDGADFGQIMKQVMQATKGQADGKMVSNLVRAKLS